MTAGFTIVHCFFVSVQHNKQLKLNQTNKFVDNAIIFIPDTMVIPT